VSDIGACIGSFRGMGAYHLLVEGWVGHQMRAAEVGKGHSVAYAVADYEREATR
jgi:hypothetical protein